jgi:predicted flavoprotein YhiN
MESRLVRGLYFAGEVLDIDGDSGGYDLQAARSPAPLATQAMKKARPFSP